MAIVDDSSYITMWNRLLQLYTNPGTLFSWVNKQIGDFRPVREGIHEEIVYFAKELERIHSDPNQIDKSFPAKIQTTKVDELAAMLPPSIIERWNRKYIKLDVSSKLARFTHNVVTREMFKIVIFSCIPSLNKNLSSVDSKMVIMRILTTSRVEVLENLLVVPL